MVFSHYFDLVKSVFNNDLEKVSIKSKMHSNHKEILVTNTFIESKDYWDALFDEKFLDLPKTKEPKRKHYGNKHFTKGSLKLFKTTDLDFVKSEIDKIINNAKKSDKINWN